MYDNNIKNEDVTVVGQVGVYPITYGQRQHAAALRKSKVSKHVRFSGNPMPTGGDFFRQLDQLHLPQQDFLGRVLQEENLLGEGASGRVYRIPMLPDFVLKTPKAYPPQPPWERTVMTYSHLRDVNVGQTIATLSTRNSFQPIEVKLFQPGLSAGVCTSTKFERTQETDKALVQCLQRTAAMPQSAYNTLLQELRLIQKEQHRFAWENSGNILVDPESKRFNIVEIERRGIDWSDKHHYLLMMVYTLTDGLYTKRSSSTTKVSQPLDQEIQQLRAQILQKCLTAAATAKLDVPLKGDALMERYATMEECCTMAGLNWPKLHQTLTNTDASSTD